MQPQLYKKIQKNTQKVRICYTAKYTVSRKHSCKELYRIFNCLLAAKSVRYVHKWIKRTRLNSRGQLWQRSTKKVPIVLQSSAAVSANRSMTTSDSWSIIRLPFGSEGQKFLWENHATWKPHNQYHAISNILMFKIDKLVGWARFNVPLDTV